MPEFQTHGVYTTSNHGGYEIEINNTGESARVRENYGQEKLSNGRRQEVKHDTKGRAYVMHYSKKLLLENFMRVESRK